MYLFLRYYPHMWYLKLVHAVRKTANIWFEWIQMEIPILLLTGECSYTNRLQLVLTTKWPFTHLECFYFIFWCMYFLIPSLFLIYLVMFFTSVLSFILKSCLHISRLTLLWGIMPRICTQSSSSLSGEVMLKHISFVGMLCYKVCYKK
jgi:hypothetical protein